MVGSKRDSDTPASDTRDSDTWIFNAQAVSTLLIAAWYIYSVLLALGIGSDRALYDWGSTWVIPLLLSVFYFGAGYLFQRQQQVVSFSSWRTFMKRKTIVLLTPFFAFTILTLAAASVVETQPALVERGIIAPTPPLSLASFIHAVLIEPVGPVGYFIVLWGFFIITRTPRTARGMGALLALALMAKICAIVLASVDITSAIPYYLLHMMNNWIWFALGMTVQFFSLQERLGSRSCAVGAFGGFCLLFLAFFTLGITDAALLTVLSVFGLASFYCISGARFLHSTQNRFFGFVTQYTMAIWLMHQILAKLCFCALFAMGVSWIGPLGAATGIFAGAWVPIYALTCLFACYLLPIFVMKVLSRVWKLGFIVYPSRYLSEKL